MIINDFFSTSDRSKTSEPQCLLYFSLLNTVKALLHWTWMVQHIGQCVNIQWCLYVAGPQGWALLAFTGTTKNFLTQSKCPCKRLLEMVELSILALLNLPLKQYLAALVRIKLVTGDLSYSCPWGERVMLAPLLSHRQLVVNWTGVSLSFCVTQLNINSVCFWCTAPQDTHTPAPHPLIIFGKTDETPLCDLRTSISPAGDEVGVRIWLYMYAQSLWYLIFIYYLSFILCRKTN